MTRDLSVCISFVRNTFAGSDHLQSQTKARRDELAALRRGILPETRRLLGFASHRQLGEQFGSTKPGTSVTQQTSSRHPTLMAVTSVSPISRALLR